MPVQRFYDKAFDWILLFGPKILLATLVLVVGEWLIKQLHKKLKNSFKSKRVTPTLRPFFQSLIFIALQILLILLVMQILGIQLTIFAAVIAAFGAAAGLALSGTLQNFASGILILLLKPFVVGDNIIAQQEEGTVMSIQLFYTVLLTFDNRTLIIPNSKLSNEVIVNITREGKRRLDILLKLGYDVPPGDAKNIITNVLTTSKNVLQEPAPRMGVEMFDNDGYKLAVHIWVNAHGFHDTRLTLNEVILQELQAAKIEMPKK